MVGDYASAPRRTQLLKTIKSWGESFCVSFEIYINSFKAEKKWQSIIHFTTGGNAGRPGFRAPAVWARWAGDKEGVLLFSLNDGTTAVEIDKFKIKHWCKVVIEQKSIDFVSFSFTN